jgi:hypothetical protein
MYLVFIDENRRMKPVLRRGERDEGEQWRG